MDIKLKNFTSKLIKEKRYLVLSAAPSKTSGEVASLCIQNNSQHGSSMCRQVVSTFVLKKCQKDPDYL